MFKRTERKAFEALLALAPIFALQLHHWAAAFLIALSCFAIYHLAHARFHLQSLERIDWFVVACLSAPFLGVGIAQILRWDLLLRDFDAPMRLLLGIPIFFYISRNQINAIRALTLGFSLALVSLPFSIDASATEHFGGRLSLALTDVNTLGSYAAIFTLVLLPSLSVAASSRVFKGVLYLALILGLYILIGTQSRGSWIAFCAALFYYFLASFRHSRSQVIAAAILILSCTILFVASQPDLRARMTSVVSESWRWAVSDDESSSGGARLGMYKVSIYLFLEKPLTGFGDFGYRSRLLEPDVVAVSAAGSRDLYPSGPHSELLARGLQSGIWGIIGVMLLYLGPFVIFRKLDMTNQASAVLRITGNLFVIGMCMLQFTIEPYTLKHTVSLNAFILASLIGQVVQYLRSLKESNISLVK